jgi:hypothetical protein
MVDLIILPEMEQILGSTGWFHFLEEVDVNVNGI